MTADLDILSLVHDLRALYTAYATDPASVRDEAQQLFTQFNGASNLLPAAASRAIGFLTDIAYDLEQQPSPEVVASIIADLDRAIRTFATPSEPFRLVGAGNSPGRSFFILTKSTTFIPFFARILLGAGFSDLGDFEQRSPYDSEGRLLLAENSIYRFMNHDYDFDVVCTADRLFLIVRASADDCQRIASAVLTATTIGKGL